MIKRVTTISGISFRFITRFLSEAESRQFLAGELAVAYRDDAALKRLGESMTTPTSQHCRALHLIKTGALDEAECLLDQLIVTGPPLLQARALISMGAVHLRRSDVGAAEIAYNRAAGLASDRFTAIHAARAHALFAALRGYHLEALSELDRGFLLVDILPRSHPLRLDFYNSIAVELIEIGRFEEAARTIGIVLGSPVAHRYPEWVETALDERLAPATRLMFVPKLPIPEPSPLAAVIPFRRPSEITPEERTRQLRFKLRELAASPSTSEAVLGALIELGESDPLRFHTVQKVLQTAKAGLRLIDRAASEQDEDLLNTVHRFWDRFKRSRARSAERKEIR